MTFASCLTFAKPEFLLPAKGAVGPSVCNGENLASLPFHT